MNIESEVLARIVPTEIEDLEVKRIVTELKQKIVEVSTKFKIDTEPILVGSIAKGTYLKHPDIDIFLMFAPETTREELEAWGLKIGKTILKGEERYAEHPYMHGIYKGLEVDIVPCYRIVSPTHKMSAVDRTPFHTKYILANLKPEQRNEVRLLKQFMKGIGVYGAEAEIEGFSGYLSELLILYYGDFQSVLESAKNWKWGTVIKLKETSSPKFNNPLVVIDPVDASRNAASAVSVDNFSTFIYASQKYLSKRKIEFFFPKKIVPLSLTSLAKLLKNRGTEILGLKFELPDVVRDILFPQLRKCLHQLTQLYEKYEFEPLNANFFVLENDSKKLEEVLYLFELKTLNLPKAQKHFGPPVWHKNSAEFMKKWAENEKKLTGPYIENGKWVVDIEHEFTNLEELIKNKIDTLSLGKDITPKIRKKMKILKTKEILSKEYARQLTIFLEKKFPWEY